MLTNWTYINLQTDLALLEIKPYAVKAYRNGIARSMNTFSVADTFTFNTAAFRRKLYMHSVFMNQFKSLCFVMHIILRSIDAGFQFSFIHSFFICLFFRPSTLS
jgi:hypothetical protein